MPAQTIYVEIEASQLVQLQKNNYSLYLAKMVNNSYTVIWQSQGSFPTAKKPVSYGPRTSFNIQVPSYQVDYSSQKITTGSVTASSSGNPCPILTGQTVVLGADGLFGDPKNEGSPGTITINNQRLGFPYNILMDSNGNPIFANTSGMAIGSTELTPIDTYQIWFESDQDSGTIIVKQASEVAVVKFDGDTTSQTISFAANGTWQVGPLS